ncbi:MAG TPA: SDR family oxidoreductase [Acidimicrobiia bacterium]|nr:SDR family oxidoreductase [Acidimicrobiia bacterium]
MTSTDASPVPAYPDLLRLDGRGYVVVGAGQGIGRQTSHALAQAGAKVVCVDAVDELANEIADEVDGVPQVVDATKREEVERSVADAREALGGRIDGLVDIIGMARYQQFLDTTDDDWDWTFDIVLRHAFFYGQAAGRVMAEQGDGTMVFIASVSGITSAPLHSPYGAAKAGLMSLVRSMAVELGPQGVRVNAVAPGVVWTPRVSQILGDEGREMQSGNAPLRRVAEPPDIAAAALFLASPLSSYIAGHTIVVDGGVSAKFPFPMGM